MDDANSLDVSKREIAIPIIALTIKRSLTLRTLDMMEGAWEVALPAINRHCKGAGKTVENAVHVLVTRLQEPPWRKDNNPLFEVSDDWISMLQEAIPDDYRLSSILALREGDPSRSAWEHLRTWAALGGIEHFDCSRHTGEQYRVTTSHNPQGDIVSYTVEPLTSGEPPKNFDQLGQLEMWLYVPEERQPAE